MPNILLAVVMGVPTFLIGYLPLPTILVIILQVCAGVLIYVGGSILLKMDTFWYLVDILKKTIHMKGQVK